MFACILAVGASARAELIQNGGFETTTGVDKQIGYNTTVSDWASANGNRLNFVFGEGSVSATGTYGDFTVWASTNGGAVGNTFDGVSPAGGNFIVADGDSRYSAALEQTIGGLVVGQKYDLSFWWAAGQQRGFDGATTELSWIVSFGGETHSTEQLTNPEHDFQPWRQTTLQFTATSEVQTLSFLAWGLPNTGSGIPPLLFLDGVSMNAVPEPTSVALMGLGIAGLVALKRRNASAG
ncbi:MAG: hypothetical protein BGO49_02115 [Planctomycetales bacterium 71-10]|nr:MAG: hypothetical protein BGO49_02115 [Planctomycetales bacterium 71-10]